MYRNVISACCADKSRYKCPVFSKFYVDTIVIPRMIEGELNRDTVSHGKAFRVSSNKAIEGDLLPLVKLCVAHNHPRSEICFTLYSLLVLDATPLITQSASALQQFGQEFHTTPGVRAELKDEHSKSQLAIWGDTLVVRQPKQISINKVSAVAKLTGDYAALSMNDVHVIALAYELEYLKNEDRYLHQ